MLILIIVPVPFADLSCCFKCKVSFLNLVGGCPRSVLLRTVGLLRVEPIYVAALRRLVGSSGKTSPLASFLTGVIAVNSVRWKSLDLSRSEPDFGCIVDMLETRPSCIVGKGPVMSGLYLSCGEAMIGSTLPRCIFGPATTSSTRPASGERSRLFFISY